MAETKKSFEDDDMYQVKVSVLTDESLNKPLQQMSKSGQVEHLIIAKNPPVITQDNQKYVPVKVKLTDGRQTVEFVPFDECFKIVSKVWDLPEYGKDAELVTVDRKMQNAAPYNLFFNCLKHCPETKDQLSSVSFKDLLCPSLGKLKASFHITFMAQIWWILENFASRKLHKLPMTILHGCDELPWPKDEILKTLYPDIDYHYIMKAINTISGGHHPKCSMFVYDDDSIRLVIGSASLYGDDWSIYNQQLWISPRCPKLPEDRSVLDGESPTGFKMALLDYLSAYGNMKISSLEHWIEQIKNADFREIKVGLLYAVPGIHAPGKNGCFAHFLGHLLSENCTIPAPEDEHDSWQVVAQTASLGLVGRTPEEWLTTSLLKSLAAHKGSPYLLNSKVASKVKFSLIFPTIRNIRNSYLGMNSGVSCRYEKGVKGLQPWLLAYQCQWKADKINRTRAIARTKCYCRISPCWQKMAYFFMTSANLSRAGWGSKPNPDGSIFIRSYEMGVLFLPKYFEEEYFEIMQAPDRKNKRLFPIMFDLPLTPYRPDDDSFCSEMARLNLNEPDDKKAGATADDHEGDATGNRQMGRSANYKRSAGQRGRRGFKRN